VLRTGHDELSLPEKHSDFYYPKFADPLRGGIRDRAHEACGEAGIEIEHVSKSPIRKAFKSL